MCITVMEKNSNFVKGQRARQTFILLNETSVVPFDPANVWRWLDNYFLSVCTWVKWQLPSLREIFYFFVLFVITAFVLNS